MRVLEGRIKKRIPPVRDGNYRLLGRHTLYRYDIIKKRIPPVRDGNIILISPFSVFVFSVLKNEYPL